VYVCSRERTRALVLVGGGRLRPVVKILCINMQDIEVSIANSRGGSLLLVVFMLVITVHNIVAHRVKLM
jgi:hypothetical protein